MTHCERANRACIGIEGSTTSGSHRTTGPTSSGDRPPLVPTFGGDTKMESPYMTTSPAWDRPARTLADYVNQTGRLPRQSGSDDAVEKKAGNALRALRSKLSAGTLEPDARTWLDEHITGWAQDNSRPAARGMRGHRTFAGHARAVQRYIDRHGRMPSASGKSLDERRLGVFLRNNRQASKGKGTTAWTQSKHRMLDRLVPGWDLHLQAVPASTAVDHDFQGTRSVAAF